MKLSVGIFFGGLFGALGILIFLVAFGTDYWLLATEVEKCSKNQSAAGEDTHDMVTLHHEGLFWRCWFEGESGNGASGGMLKFWFTNQSPSKNCTHAYLSPFPLNREDNKTAAYDSAIIYRGFWTVFMLLGVVTIVTAGFLIICAAPFSSHGLYKAGGGLFIAAGIFFSLVVVLYVIWVQVMSNLEGYKKSRQEACAEFSVYVRYGWSFMVAPFGIFFSLFAGMLFLLVGRTIQQHTK
ncbi:transmembrane protein 182 [Ambystoma mexicanum]|uniref:transmembrane protein 182 n=1 Tax=Ambystoma mexicanum TaxID=8296 RepID=UPI0037E82E12